MMVMTIAEKFGQSPSDVENWDTYWFRRAALIIEGEHEYNQEQERARKRKANAKK